MITWGFPKFAYMSAKCWWILLQYGSFYRQWLSVLYCQHDLDIICLIFGRIVGITYTVHCTYHHLYPEDMTCKLLETLMWIRSWATETLFFVVRISANRCPQPPACTFLHCKDERHLAKLRQKYVQNNQKKIVTVVRETYFFFSADALIVTTYALRRRFREFWQ